jgi:hypothetical protein
MGTEKDGRTLALVGEPITIDRAFIKWAIVSTVKCSAEAMPEDFVESRFGKTAH